MLVNDVSKAAECVASILLSDPKNQAMLNNKKYFQNEFQIPDSKFRPRPEAISYYRQIQNEQSLLDFVKESFSKFDKKEVPTVTEP